MKIKLKDYSLISNEWLDREIKYQELILDSSDNTPGTDFANGRLSVLRKIKRDLILSEKLAEKCFEQGEYCAKEKLELVFDNPIGRFLNSEIEIE